MKVAKKRAKSLNKIVPPKILSLGYYDINYTITLSEDDMLKFHIENLANLTSIEDISFIMENQYLWAKIFLETENKAINLLLYLNKISMESNKSYIEYIPYEQPVYYNSKVKEMFETVNDFHYFFVNACPLIPESKKYFSLTIKYKDQQTVITFDRCEGEDDANKNVDNEVMKEGSYQQNNEEQQNDENDQNLKNENNVFNKVKLQFQKYNYFICSIEESIKNEPYKFEDLIEFVANLKLKYGALITVEYDDISNYFSDKESMTQLNKLYLITDIFLFDQVDTVNNFKKHYELLTKEKEKDKNKYQFDERKDNQSNYDVQSIYQRCENDDVKSQVSSNNNVKKINNQIKRKKEKEMTVRDVFEYFKRTIACNGALSILNSKLGIFLDENFSKVTFIEVPMNIKAIELSYEIKPYPKLSHTTVDLVQFYKDNLNKKRPFFRSILYAGILSKIFSVQRKNFGIEVLYSGYLTGLEIVKRLLHLATCNIPFPDNQMYYIVKIDNNEVDKYVKNEYLNKKENKFVLDCTNLQKSKLKNYVPLFDYNLHEFFENKLIQKDLADKGFINSKGFVNYDPYYRKGMGIPKKKNMRYMSANNPKYLVKKQVEVNTKNMRSRILLNPTISTNVKLPIIQCRVSEKVNNYDKYYGKRCSHGYNQKCQYCDLYEKAKIEIDFEEKRRRDMQLRRYKKP